MTALTALQGRSLPCRCDGDWADCPLCEATADLEVEPRQWPRELTRSELDDAVPCAHCGAVVGVIEGADPETGWPTFGWVMCFVSDDGPICEECA